MKINNETEAKYVVGQDRNDEDNIIKKALDILAKRCQPGEKMSDPETVENYIRLKIGQLEHEVFGAIFTNSQNRVVAIEELFRGTLSEAAIYPREVVKTALKHNAGAVVFYHNHPSGDNAPSKNDITLTKTLKSALDLVDVRVLDHFVVSATGCVSMAEKRLI